MKKLSRERIAKALFKRNWGTRVRWRDQFPGFKEGLYREADYVLELLLLKKGAKRK